MTAMSPTFGTLASTAVTIGSGATTAAHRIANNNGTANLFYDADGSGAGAQVQIDSLSTAPAVTSADFIII